MSRTRPDAPAFPTPPDHEDPGITFRELTELICIAGCLANTDLELDVAVGLGREAAVKYFDQVAIRQAPDPA